MNSCNKKRRFDSEIEARKERLFVQDEHNKKFRIYRCSSCEGWHFSTIN